MYKKIILFSVCCLLSGFVQAQGFKGGLHVGLLATQVDGDGYGGYNKLGFFGGIFTNFALPNKTMQLQFELNYAQKGSAAKPIYRMSMQQVEPTILFGWTFWKKFMLEAGISCNILVSAKEYANLMLVPSEFGSNFYRFNVDFIGGLTYRFNEHWGASFRFSYSTPTGRINTLSSGKGVEKYMTNSCLLFRLYYQF